ncbi:aromatic ring-hydroxylating dioxygenase subunit alpha [Zavarzinia sp.]|uniref:aromatic ring-hydroxylating dioxygenase subunit alpha n=1 Tax=Zavarzinia sp. TaxID=2027920 RepID=UPI003566B706
MTEIDPGTLNDWQVVGCLDELPEGRPLATRLLGQAISVRRRGRSAVVSAGGRDLPVLLRYGFVWTSLGMPKGDLFAIPEYDEADRRNLNGCSFGVQVSAPRAVENFLDMGHFPFVHTGILGAEPHTEVKDYDVETMPAEIVATRCMFYQPQAAVASTGGADVAYRYRVPHPYCAVLYKDSPAKPGRADVIALFIQPVTEDEIVASLVLSLLDDDTPLAELRRFQQRIFAQDKPILENQIPKRLPLLPRAEVPIRADKVSIAYRHWLRGRGVTYGVIA